MSCAMCTAVANRRLCITFQTVLEPQSEARQSPVVLSMPWRLAAVLLFILLFKQNVLCIEFNQWLFEDHPWSPCWSVCRRRCTWIYIYIYTMLYHFCTVYGVILYVYVIFEMSCYNILQSPHVMSTHIHHCIMASYYTGSCYITLLLISVYIYNYIYICKYMCVCQTWPLEVPAFL